MFLVQGMNSTSLENRSTTTRTLSNPSDLGRSVIKSVDISFQGPGGVSSGFNFPGGAWLVLRFFFLSTYPCNTYYVDVS